MSIMPLVVSLLAAGTVELHIEVREPVLLVGEPILMDVRWTATGPTTVLLERDDRCFGSTRLLVEGPAGKGFYREPRRETCEAPLAPLPMKAGEEARTSLKFFSLGGWLTGDARSTSFEPSLIFAQPGEYRLRLVYIGGKSNVLSNEVKVRVDTPAPEERLLLEQIRVDPTITYHAREWLKEYPRSRYLAWSRLTSASSRLSSGQVASDRKAETDRRLEIVSDLLEQEWGQFEEEALRAAYHGATPAGKDGLVAEIAAKLLAKYPDSVTVRELRLKEQYGSPAATDGKPR